MQKTMEGILIVCKVRGGFLQEGLQPNVQGKLWTGEAGLARMEKVERCGQRGAYPGPRESGKAAEEKVWD